MRLFPLAILVVGSSGCLGSLGRTPTVPDLNQTQSPVNPVVDEPAQAEPDPMVVRSQSPPVPLADPIKAVSLTVPATVPLTRITPPEKPIGRVDPQVRIVATIGATPIYDQEVWEAIYQRSRETKDLPSFARKPRKKNCTIRN